MHCVVGLSLVVDMGEMRGVNPGRNPQENAEEAGPSQGRPTEGRGTKSQSVASQRPPNAVRVRPNATGTH